MDAPYSNTSLSTHEAGKQSRTDEADSEEDSSPVMYDRFFVIKSSSAEQDNQQTFSICSGEKLQSCSWNSEGCEAPPDDNILMKVASVVQSQNIVKLQTLVDCPVTVTPHQSLNTCKGVVRCRNLIDCDRDETLNGLKSQGVVDISNVTVKMTGGIDRTPMLSQ